ncbi:MAG: PLP-dependent aminotransferase family protein, partial [Janthinobacterium sp.]
MDYNLLLATFERVHHERGWPRQRLLHECLRAAIRGGQLAPGTRLAATRGLASDRGGARTTGWYAYEQLASEGFVLPDRRGTVVAGSAGAGMPLPASGTSDGLSRRARQLRGVAGQDSCATVVLPADAMGAFAPGVPALDEFPLAQ